MKTLVALTAALLLVAPPAFAEEVQREGTTDAERCGRLLLAHDAAKRAEGEALLLARIKSGGDLQGFVRRMAAAARQWANNEHRLVDTWIRLAVEGDLEQRERAVRLITAMGEKAVMRLALELRHQVRHGGDVQNDAEPPRPAAPDAAAQGPTTPQVAVTPHTPRVYDVSALRAKGMNPVQVLSFLRKEADASEVGSGPTRYVVYADADGHERLVKKLDEIRLEVARAKKSKPDTGSAQKQESKEAEDGGAKEGDKPAAAGEDDLPPRTAEQTASDETPASPAPAPGTVEVAASGPSWIVRPLVVRVPRDASLAARIGKWDGISKEALAPILAVPGAGRQKARPTSAAIVGTLAAVKVWGEKAPALPEARTSYGEHITIVPGREAQGFVGRQVPYRRDVRQAKQRGAWRVDQDILQSGLELRFQLTTRDDALHVRLNTRLSEVSKPMATTQVRPEKGAEPIELDVPEWNRQTRSDTFEIAPAGGGLLMVMPDPAKAEKGLVLVVLRVEPAPAPQQGAANVNPNGQQRLGPVGRREGN